ELRECQAELELVQAGRPPGDAGEMLKLLDRAAAVIERLNTLAVMRAERQKVMDRLEERLLRQEAALGQAGRGGVNPWPALAALVLLGGPGAALAIGGAE